MSRKTFNTVFVIGLILIGILVNVLFYLFTFKGVDEEGAMIINPVAMFMWLIGDIMLGLYYVRVHHEFKKQKEYDRILEGYYKNREEL